MQPQHDTVTKQQNTRKRSASQMMMTTEAQHVHDANPKDAKRQKLENKQSLKIKHSIEELKRFSNRHNGKLPSLRGIMQKLKVGFPKAHEIIEFYAKYIGKTVHLYSHLYTLH